MTTANARTLYDFVKVKVWLSRDGQANDQPRHYYILSRYMLARSLQAASLPYSSAIKASLLLKRYLVDASILSLDQATLERILLALIREHGLATPEELKTWSMVTRFQQSRTPLVIVMVGDSCDAKTRVAHALSERLHFNYVIRTDALEDMMFAEEKGTRCDNTARDDSASGTAVGTAAGRNTGTRMDQDVVFRSVQNDVAKAFKDGKSIIIEGGGLEGCLGRFVVGAYDADIVPAECLAGGLVTVLADSKTNAPVLVDVVGATSLQNSRLQISNGSMEHGMRERGSHHAAMVVPVRVEVRGRAKTSPTDKDYCPAGASLPVFQLDESASPEDNTDQMHGWILSAIKMHVC
jgi:hypothetical protein